MNATGCSRRTKSIAKAMLFVWLFSLAVGVANACVLSESRTDARWHDRAAGSQPLHGAEHAPVVAPAAGPAAAHSADEPDSGQQACKSFCDSEQSAVTKTRTADLTDAPPLAVATGALWLRVTARTDATWRIDAAAPPPQLAVAIRFLRLTL